MRSILATLAATGLCILCLVRVAWAASPITYEVTPDFAARQLAIVMAIPHSDSGPIRLQIPTWSPGAYMVGDYAARIADVSASGTHGTVPVTHPDHLTWEIGATADKEVRISYRVNQVDAVQTDAAAPKRAHITGPRSYLYVVGHKQDPARLVVHAPSGFKIACSLDPATGDGAYTAPNYDVLADAPVEMGDYGEENFTARGVPHKLVIYGDYSQIDRPKLLDYCKRISETEIGFFNDAPFKRYVFMFRCTPRGNGGGGLEHLGSTEISIAGPVSDRTRSVIAHEYFHAWNVKRIRPAVLGPFDYSGPVRTSNLWWSEGVTSYYGDLLSRRGGLNTDQEYLKHLGDTIGQLQANPARLKVTADESSYKVWDGGGSQGFGRLSYYTKGELIGLCLDLKIRDLTHNRKSLDDVMRSLYAQCARGKGPGFPEDGIRTTVNRVAGSDLSAFYDRLARSTEEMPFDECLGFAGLNGGISDKPVVTPNLGMLTRPDPDGKSIRVFVVTPDGPAASAGIHDGDRILQIDGKEISPGGPVLSELVAGRKVALTVDRDGATQEIAYTVGSTERHPWLITPRPGATPEQVRIRAGWLGGDGSTH